MFAKEVLSTVGDPAMTTQVREKQLLKAPGPMEVTDDGMEMEGRVTQVLKAPP